MNRAISWVLLLAVFGLTSPDESDPISIFKVPFGYASHEGQLLTTGEATTNQPATNIKAGTANPRNLAIRSVRDVG
jgi:hypothetical protein